MKKIEVPEIKLRQLVRYFYEVCAFCDELDIYEWKEADQDMQEMKEWVKENFEK